jgi:hypothetical protein
VIVPHDGLQTGLIPAGGPAPAGSVTITSARASTAKNTVNLVILTFLF